jgi:hypothetical protein
MKRRYQHSMTRNRRETVLPSKLHHFVAHITKFVRFERGKGFCSALSKTSRGVTCALRCARRSCWLKARKLLHISKQHNMSSRTLLSLFESATNRCINDSNKVPDPITKTSVSNKLLSETFCIVTREVSKRTEGIRACVG